MKLKILTSYFIWKQHFSWECYSVLRSDSEVDFWHSFQSNRKIRSKSRRDECSRKTMCLMCFDQLHSLTQQPLHSSCGIFDSVLPVHMGHVYYYHLLALNYPRTKQRPWPNGPKKSNKNLPSEAEAARSSLKNSLWVSLCLSRIKGAKKCRQL